MSVVCDRETHRYYDQDTGERYDGVTEILQRMGFIRTNQFTDPTLGSLVHEALRMIHMGLMKPCDFATSEIAGYIEAYETFREVHEFNPWPGDAEKVLHRPSARVAGTVDVAGTVYGGNTLIDFKTGKPQRWHPVQGAAYRWLWPGDDIAFVNVYLQPNGEYRLVRAYQGVMYGDPRWFRAFAAALTCYRWHRNEPIPEFGA